MAFSKPSSTAIADINMTPMIDVLLVLIVHLHGPDPAHTARPGGPHRSARCRERGADSDRPPP